MKEEECAPPVEEGSNASSKMAQQFVQIVLSFSYNQQRVIFCCSVPPAELIEFACHFDESGFTTSFSSDGISLNFDCFLNVASFAKGGNHQRSVYNLSRWAYSYFYCLLPKYLLHVSKN